MTTRPRSRTMKTPARIGLTGVPEERSDASTSQVPAVDHGGLGREDQDHRNPSVGVGPDRGDLGWPSPSEFWP